MIKASCAPEDEHQCLPLGASASARFHFTRAEENEFNRPHHHYHHRHHRSDHPRRPAFLSRVSSFALISALQCVNIKPAQVSQSRSDADHKRREKKGKRTFCEPPSIIKLAVDEPPVIFRRLPPEKKHVNVWFPSSAAEGEPGEPSHTFLWLSHPN